MYENTLHDTDSEPKSDLQGNTDISHVSIDC